MSVAQGTLRYADSVLNITLHDGASIAKALLFLETHFEWTEGTRETDNALADLSVYPEHTPLPDAPRAGTDWADIYVRKSASPFFTIPAKRATVGDEDFIECVGTGTLIGFHPDQGRIDVVLPEGGYLDFVELVRDLVLRDQENRGVAVLHAASAERDGSLVVVTGPKGAGKSTILLELVDHYGYTIVGGDKTLARIDSSGSVMLTGWPDFPHLGFGTIDKYPALRKLAGIGDDYVPLASQAFSPYSKFPVDFTGFREQFPSAHRGFRAPASEFLFPQIGPEARTQLAESTQSDASRVVGGNLESAFTGAHAGWHRFVPDRTAEFVSVRQRIVSALSATPARAVTGPGNLPEAGFAPIPERLRA